MREETRHVALPVSCTDVYDFLADYRNDALWRAEMKSVSLKSGTPGSPGSTYEAVLDWHGLTVPHELEFVECERPSLIRTRSLSPNLRIEVLYSLCGEDSLGCSLSATYTLDMQGPLLVLEPFGWSLLIGWVGDDLPNLAEAISAQRAS